MNPIFEKLEQQFEALKKGDISGYDFFNGLWSPLATLKGQTKELLNAVYVWTKERSGADPANFGLATIALGLLAMHEDRIEDGLKSAAEASGKVAAAAPRTRPAPPTAGDEPTGEIDGRTLSIIRCSATDRSSSRSSRAPA